MKNLTYHPFSKKKFFGPVSIFQKLVFWAQKNFKSLNFFYSPGGVRNNFFLIFWKISWRGNYFLLPENLNLLPPRRWPRFDKWHKIFILSSLLLFRKYKGIVFNWFSSIATILLPNLPIMLSPFIRTLCILKAKIYTKRARTLGTAERWLLIKISWIAMPLHFWQNNKLFIIKISW